MFKLIAAAIAATPTQVEAAVALMDEGATVPFIARYRKEVTGGLSDEQLRDLARLLKQQRALADRRSAILKALKASKQLDAKLEKLIHEAQTKAELEAIYAPFKSTRKTKADAAREQGLEPVAQALLAGKTLEQALAQVKSKVKPEDAQAGAREIVVDVIAKDIPKLRAVAGKMETAPLMPRAVRGKQEEAARWVEQARPETAKTMPGHRALGLFRALKEGIIAFEVEPEVSPVNDLVRGLGTSGNAFLRDAGEEAWKGRVGKTVKNQVLEGLRERAQREAIEVFRKNLKDLLLAAPAGPKPILGLDPGLRTGIKAALIDPTGKVLATATLMPMRDAAGAGRELKALASKAALIALGNGTGSREAAAWCDQVLGKSIQRVVVSEAGASVYSASELASEELPDMDVSLRGAVSIARRLQDPLAELVKIDPRSLGVGQYQHDVDAGLLSDALDGVVQDAVAVVGVDVNTASPALLAHVPGIGESLARKIVEHRNKNGAFLSRAALKKVSGLGAKAFEQAAGFLRVYGKEPLDATAVHPESYDIARLIAKQLGVVVADAMSHASLKTIKPESIDPKRVETVRDVLIEMSRPGRDPRPQLRTARLEEAITTIDDLKVGMRLEGTVSNVAAFGAFVDLGVHQDGLVHVSQMSEEFVSDPAQVVSVGQVVRVRILEVDKEKKRISLSMKPERVTQASASPSAKPASKGSTKPTMSAGPVRKASEPSSDSPFAALSALKKR